MNQKFTLKQIHKTKTKHFREKLKKFGPRQHAGRPRKNKNLKMNPISFSKLVTSPSQIQSFDQFSEIPKQILKYCANGNYYSLWISNSSERLYDSIKFQKIFDTDPMKQKFFEFMSIVLQKTNESLGLNSQANILLKELMEAFVSVNSFQENENLKEEDIKDAVKKLFNGNVLWKNVLILLCNEKLLNGILEAFILWKKLFDQQFKF